MVKPPTSRWVTFIVLLLIIQSRLSAQLSAEFSASPVSGCSPVVVHFTDLSSGGPTQWRWDLGNGVTSFLQNPSSSYFNPGIYNVKLVIQNATGSDTIVKSQYITVYANPVAAFTASDSSGCFPLPVQFTDLSSQAGGSITTWSWDFGDGNTSAQQHPFHIYTDAGNFTVTLRVTNSFGCTKTYTKNQFVQTSDGVTADFTNNAPGNCPAPVTINFTNTTTGPGALTYSWDFGDASGSTSTNPVHTYNAPGVYTVTLIAMSPQGCIDTMRKINHITIGTILSQFNSPASICEGQSFALTNTSTPAPVSSQWNFGDATTSAQINPVKTYSTAGTYTIKLVNDFGGCADSVSRSIVVKQKPVAAFTSNDTLGCQVPFTANFINQSAGSNNCFWDFGDGGTSNLPNPSHTFTATGSFTVTLIITNVNGCSDTLVKTAFIKNELPVVVINGFPQKGCIPLTVHPTATVTANQPIASYLWNFGDGGTSNAINPSHTYPIAGTYTVSLTITTIGGCTTTAVITDAVRAGDKPHAAFTVTPIDVCAFSQVSFTDHSTGNIDQWLWHFGDGDTSILQNPVHAYSDTGYFNVTLVVWSNGCADTLRINKAVHIRPPVARFVFSNNCTEKYTRDFYDISLGATSWLWNFGDGNTSLQQHPSHTYAAPGTYFVRLFVSNGTCTHSSVRRLRVIDERADFSPNSTIFCKENTAIFTAININPVNIESWRWDFGDGTTANSVSMASHRYDTTGVFNVTLSIIDSFGCPSVKTIPVTVYGPKALYTSTTFACLEQGTIHFTDASFSDGTNSLVKWIWNYGDGGIDSTSIPPYSHVYATPGVYTVSLTVVDNYGCRDSMTDSSSITISQPFADFNSPDTNTCTNQSIHFNNTSAGYDLQYDWSFGDGATSTVTNPVHTYSIIGSYPVDLIVTDRYGCKDTASKNGYVNISYPNALFTVSDSIGFCPPLLVNFTNSSTDYSSLSWDFGDGNTSTAVNPSHFYTIPGIYFSRLAITGPGGCTDTIIKRIEVRGPSGNFTYTPKLGCNPLAVTFTATTSNNSSFIWDFSDGTILPTADSVTTHTYTAPGDYFPKMILSDAGGCTVPVTGLEVIQVMGITASFVTDQNRFCDSGYASITNTTVSNDLITGYQWDFGDGSFSNAQHPSHHYATPGTYDIQLTVTSATGCVDSILLIDTIKVFESPLIGIIGDSSACTPATLSFTGRVDRGNAALLNWQWTLNNAPLSLLQFPPAQVFTTVGAYTITSLVTDEHGCRDSVAKTVNIHPVPVTEAGADALVCRGSFAQLNATGAAFYVWDAASSLSCTDCASPLAAPADSTLYFVTGSSPFGCSSRDSVFLRVRQPFTLLVNPSDSFCVGGSVRLSAAGADQYKWSPSTGLDNISIAKPRAAPLNSTVYTLVAKDNDNCFTDTAQVFVKVNPLPTVEAGADITIAVGSAGQLQATGSANIVGWKWTPAYNLSCYTCPNPKTSTTQTIQYTVEVTSNGGCRSRDNLTVFVTCNNGNLFVPNTFSPNNDGANDRFYPRGSGINLVKSFRIYNRWGEIVFERLNFNVNDAGYGWDGTHKGQKLAPDVFVYSCEVMCENNQPLLFKGDVTLLR